MIKQIDPSFIKNKILTLDIVNLISKILPTGKMSGRSYKINCPFHQEKNPSLVLSKELGVFHCFGCGTKGNAISFFMKYRKTNFTSAVQEIASLENLEIRYINSSISLKKKLMYSVLEAANQCFFGNFPLALNYLKTRDIDLSTVEKYQIGYSSNLELLRQSYAEDTILLAGLLKKDSQDKYRPFFQDRIIFPIKNQSGQVVAFGGRITTESHLAPKYINSPENLVFKKSDELYGLHELICEQGVNIEHITLVEGYFDVVSLSRYGYKNSVATLSGALSSAQAKKVISYTNKIFICFDGDVAGIMGTKKAFMTILAILSENSYNVDVRFVNMPKGYDPDKYIREFGLSAFKELLMQAVNLSAFFISIVDAENIYKVLAKAREILGEISTSMIKIALIHDLAAKKQLRAQDLSEILTQKQKIQLSASQQIEAIDSISSTLIFILQQPQKARSIISDLNIGSEHLSSSKYPAILLYIIELLLLKTYSSSELEALLIDKYPKKESLITQYKKNIISYSPLEFKSELRKMFIEPYRKQKIEDFFTELIIK